MRYEIAFYLFDCTKWFDFLRAKTDAEQLKIPMADKTAPAKDEAVATFAEGCFWHSEIVFQSLLGVRDAVAGYAGGTDPNPDDEKVSIRFRHTFKGPFKH